MLKKIFKHAFYFLVPRSEFRVQKGISIYLVILISTFILAVALGLSTILISRIKVSHEIGYSVVALYAADTGIERILYEIRSTPPTCDPTACATFPCCNSSSTLSNGAGYNVYVASSTPAVRIKSIGNYQTVNRAIEISY